jgi:hypothetical protein
VYGFGWVDCAKVAAVVKPLATATTSAKVGHFMVQDSNPLKDVRGEARIRRAFAGRLLFRRAGLARRESRLVFRLQCHDIAIVARSSTGLPEKTPRNVAAQTFCRPI